MIEAESFVLDASALLAYLRAEPGGAVVREVLEFDAVINAVNWTEVLTRLGELTDQPVELLNTELAGAGLGGDLLPVIPVTHRDAVAAAALRSVTRPLGLSLADRACLATGMRLAATVLTADRAWESLSVGVPVRIIR